MAICVSEREFLQEQAGLNSKDLGTRRSSLLRLQSKSKDASAAHHEDETFPEAGGSSLPHRSALAASGNMSLIRRHAVGGCAMMGHRTTGDIDDSHAGGRVAAHGGALGQYGQNIVKAQRPCPQAVWPPPAHHVPTSPKLARTFSSRVP